MRVIGFVASLMVLSVGSWAHFHYGEIVKELKNNHGLPAEDAYDPPDSVWGYFDFVWESFESDLDSSIHGSQSARSSGVQANPHLVCEE